MRIPPPPTRYPGGTAAQPYSASGHPGTAPPPTRQPTAGRGFPAAATRWSPGGATVQRMQNLAQLVEPDAFAGVPLYHGTRRVYAQSIVNGIDVTRTTNLIESGGRPCFYTTTSKDEAFQWASAQTNTDLAESYASGEISKRKFIMAALQEFALVVVRPNAGYGAAEVVIEALGHTAMIMGTNQNINNRTTRHVMGNTELSSVISKWCEQNRPDDV